MPTTLRYVSPTLPTVQPQRVYLRDRWADEWTLLSALWCTSAEWTAAPSLPTAILRWKYGIALGPDDRKFLGRLRERNRLRFYVRTDVAVHTIGSSSAPLQWFGTLEIEQDALDGPLTAALAGGERVTYATGTNHFSCLGLEQLLEQTTVSSSVVFGLPTDYRVRRGLTFNAPGPEGTPLGNRSTAPGDAGTYVFHSHLTGGKTWSTRQIVAYLLTHHAPRDWNDEAWLTFALDDPDGILPDWDKPILAADGKSVRELLDSLIPRQRLLSWTLRVDTATGEILLRPFSFTPDEIVLVSPVGATLAANTRQFIVVPDRDRGATVSLKRSAIDQVDQVIARGARRRSVGTFSMIDGTLEEGWENALQAEYEAAASGDAGYPAAGEVSERQYVNMEARHAERLKSVFARFVLPDPFDGLIGDGVTAAAVVPLMPSDANPLVPEPLAPQDLFFASTLPLRDGYDYSGAKIGQQAVTATNAGPHRELSPLVLFRRSDFVAVSKEVYRQAEEAGATGDNEYSIDALDGWTARVHVSESDGSLLVEVTNGEQYEIAAGEFTPLAEDPPFGTATYTEMLVTAAIAWSQYAEGIYPPTATPGRDTVRRLELLAGDEFRCDYVAPDTVVGIDPESGELLRSDGGYVADDREQLRGIARLAYEWYNQVRRSLQYETTLVSSALQVGDYITSLGDPDVEGDIHDDVATVVTSLRFESPVVLSEQDVEPSAPRLTITTGFGELDPLRLGGRR